MEEVERKTSPQMVGANFEWTMQQKVPGMKFIYSVPGMTTRFLAVQRTESVLLRRARVRMRSKICAVIGLN